MAEISSSNSRISIFMVPVSFGGIYGPWNNLMGKVGG